MKNSVPSKARHTIKPADVRREERMDAGAKLFVLNGIDKTTIDDIVIEAANSKGTFYHYFKSKDEPVDALRGDFQGLVMLFARLQTAGAQGA
ncbi:helix-turn-helix transcriptional regulator (plasmid) [Mycetohabitans endofungorum]|nr:TetR/AcrR family transcriptional regulator [Mycetohabitans sp. B3]